MKAFLSVALISIFALSGVAYDPPANTNSYTRNGVTYAQRGGMGTSTYVVTNVTPTGVARTLPPYLHCVDFADTYPADAEWYYERADIIGGCSCFLHDLHFGRDYDWFRDETAVFVGRVFATETRFASVGVMNVGTNITEEIANSGQWSRFFKCLPAATLDGINSEGVVACINVVSTNGSRWEIERDGRDINAIGAVRWILDNAPSAGYAASNIASRVFIPQALQKRGYSAHFMIADERTVWIVEDGVAHQTSEGNAVMTNFRLYDAGGNMHTQRFEVQEYDPYGTGLERLYWIYRHLSDISDRLDSPEAVLKAAWFSEAYRRPFQRPTEFVGMEPSLTLRSPDSELEAWAEAHIPQGAPESLKSGGGSWMTVHSSVYDITNRILRVAVKEKDDWYAFGLPLGGRVKSVNGKTGDVALNYGDVGALPDNKTLLIDNTNFKEAVEEVSPPVVLPEKWALANVTNDSGNAVGATDVGAVANDATYAEVKSKAESAVQPDDISDMETQTHAAQTYQPKGDYLTEEIDPTVHEWAKAATKPSYTPSEVGALPDDEEELAGSANFSNAVVRVSPPVELPEKWALANVTNASGNAVTAGDVGAAASNHTHDKIVDGNFEVRADLSANARDYSGISGWTDQWEPSKVWPARDPVEVDFRWTDVWFENGQGWRSFEEQYIDGEWVGTADIYMGGDYTNHNATVLTFPDGTKTYRVPNTAETRLATTNDLFATVRSATNAVPRIVMGDLEVRADLSAKAKIGWTDEWVCVPSDRDGVPYHVEWEATYEGWAVFCGGLITINPDPHKTLTEFTVNHLGFYTVARRVHAIVDTKLATTNDVSSKVDKGAKDVVIGEDAEAVNDYENYRIAIGKGAKAQQDNSLSIGREAYATRFSSVAVGTYAVSTNQNAVSIGRSARSHGVDTFNIAASAGMWYAGDTPLVEALFKTGYSLTNVTEIVTNVTETATNDAPLSASAESSGEVTEVTTNVFQMYVADPNAPKPVMQGQETAVDLKAALLDATTNTTADCECIGTNLCKLITPHIEPVNAIAELYDPTLTALWELKMVDGEMKYTVKTNEETCAMFMANSVLKDTAETNTSWKVHVDDGNMKFFTYQ